MHGLYMVIHLPAGPGHPYSKHLVYDHLPEFVDGVLAQTEADGFRYDVLHSHYWLSGAVAYPSYLFIQFPATTPGEGLKLA